MSKKNKKCPACGELFDKRNRNGQCPECKAKLELVEYKEGQRSMMRYATTDMIDSTGGLKLDSPVKEEVTTTRIRNNMNKPLSNEVEKLSDNHWKVTFNLLPQRIVCPSCRKLQFKMITSLGGDLQRKCDRCGILIDYEFNILK